ncbi:hypothetical protein ACI77O_12900 [Pseudomonas tritici]|uniref:hypothetical protein n=1 Tax=Pseudomonas tritici TaxID=2745518 RepID=UPI00387AC20A
MKQNPTTKAVQDAETDAMPKAYVQVPNPRMSFDVVKFQGAVNTFSLFQKHGKVELDWLMPYQSETRDIGREDCFVMLGNMRAWLQTPSAESEANSVGSDLRFVHEEIEFIEASLAKRSVKEYQGVMFLAFQADDRQAQEDDARADAYCHALYGSTPYDDYDSMPKSNWYDDDPYMTFDEILDYDLEIMAEKAKGEINLMCAQALSRIESYPVSLHM